MDERDWTALHFAAANGHSAVVQLLVDRANLTAKNKDGDAAIHLAAQNGHLSVVEELFKKDSSLLVQPREENGDTAIHVASNLGNLDIVKWLVKHNVNSISVTNKEKRTALHCAVEGNHLDIVNYLIENKIDVSIRAANGETARELARKLDRWEMVECMPDRWEPALKLEPEHRPDVRHSIRQLTIQIDTQIPGVATFRSEYKPLGGLRPTLLPLLAPSEGGQGSAPLRLPSLQDQSGRPLQNPLL